MMTKPGRFWSAAWARGSAGVSAQDGARGSPPACPHIMQTRPFLPLQELQPFHRANISKTSLCQQIGLARQRGSCEGKCLCFYFILLLSHFCNCNCTNKVSHLFLPKVQGLKIGQDSVHVSSLGTGFPLHQGPSASLWQSTKVLKGLENVPCQLPLLRRAPRLTQGWQKALVCRRSLCSMGNPKGKSCGLFQNKGINFKTSCGRENTSSNQKKVLKQSDSSI